MKTSVIMFVALLVVAHDAHAGAYERMQRDYAEHSREDDDSGSRESRYDRQARRVERQQERDRRANADYLCSDRPRGCIDRWSHRN